MSTNHSQAFMDALRRTEESHDVEPLVTLFADDAALENPARHLGGRRGPDGARQFWREYLSAFEHIRSTFDRVSEGDGFTVLEWHSDGRLSGGGGEPIQYHGVSIVEFDASDRVRRFCTYYDSAAFLPQGAKHTGGAQAHA